MMEEDSVPPSIGILGRKEILAEVQKGSLVVGCQNPEERARGCSYDLTVGTIFWEGKVIREQPGSPAQVVVPPGGVIGIFTAEEIALPDDVCATAFAINEMSSKGFLVLNPGHVDPGFKGPLTVKALNVRKTNIAISQGDPIFTVIFQRLDRPTVAYRNASRSDRERKFNAETVQSSPRTVAAMIELDKEGPFPARAEVKELIRNDAISRATLAFTFIAAVAGVVAAYAALRPTAPPTQNEETSAFQGSSEAPKQPGPCSSEIPKPYNADGNILIDLGVCNSKKRIDEL
jgi:deoxycytidine triphosphate deaminase